MTILPVGRVWVNTEQGLESGNNSKYKELRFSTMELIKKIKGRRLTKGYR